MHPSDQRWRYFVWNLGRRRSTLLLSTFVPTRAERRLGRYTSWICKRCRCSRVTRTWSRQHQSLWSIASTRKSCVGSESKLLFFSSSSASPRRSTGGHSFFHWQTVGSSRCFWVPVCSVSTSQSTFLLCQPKRCYCNTFEEDHQSARFQTSSFDLVYLKTPNWW